MKFTVLGSGTSIPDARRGPAGFLVTCSGHHWLVDGGSGTLGRCMATGVDPAELTGGFYSHWHPDHMADLVPLLFSYRVRGRAEPYTIHASTGFAEVLAGLEGVFGKWIRPGGGVRVHERPSGCVETAHPGGLTVTTRPAAHSAGAVHLAFQGDGAKVVFSGDTGPSEALVELATGADLLVCECAGADDERVPGHLWPSAIASIVRRARPRAVWLTHLYPHVDPRRAIATVREAGAPTCHAYDGQSIELRTDA